MSYHFSKTVNDEFDSAIEKVTGELKKEGFGVLTHETLVKIYRCCYEHKLVLQ